MALRTFDLCYRMRVFSCSMWILSCSMWDLVSRPTIKPRPPALGPQSLGHWTIREVPMHLFYWCIGYISRSRICGSNVYTVRILGTQYTEVASRKELTYQQLGNKLLSLLFCPSDKQNCSFVLHFVDYWGTWTFTKCLWVYFLSYKFYIHIYL